MIVDTGPTLEIMATLFEPIRLIPLDTIKTGITVATIARRMPYPHRSGADCSVEKLFVKKKCKKIPAVEASMAYAVNLLAPMAGITRPLPTI